MQVYPKSYVRKDGYRVIRLRDEYGKARLILEHRLVMEAILGRKLKRTEIIHHKDENRLNNSPSNLEVMTHYAHDHHHRAWDAWISQVSHVCQRCGKTYTVQSYRDETAKYCSWACKIVALHDGLKVIRLSTPCAVCGTMITDQGRYPKKYCSAPCRAIGRGKSVSQARQRKVG